MGGDGLAIVELDVVSQVEGVGPFVVAEVPPGGDVGDDVEVGVDGDEAAEDLDDYKGGAGVRGEGGVQGGGVGEEAGELTTRAGGRVRDRRGGGQLGRGGGDGGGGGLEGWAVLAARAAGGGDQERDDGEGEDCE